MQLQRSSIAINKQTKGFVKPGKKEGLGVSTEAVCGLFPPAALESLCPRFLPFLHASIEIQVLRKENRVGLS